MKDKIYFENLNGLRFLCFLSVFCFHSFHVLDHDIQNMFIYKFIKKDIFGNGNQGVNFFFVLSGFLITYLLLIERKTNIKINILNFWVRRMLRIWPLFYLCVFIGFIGFPFIKNITGQVSNESANIFYYITFLNNFNFIENGLPDASILGVLWSVAIEEQFYFFWPLILSIFSIKKWLFPFVVILICTLIYRSYNIDNYMILEHSTFSCIGDMVVGAIGAWLISENLIFKKNIENLNGIFIKFIYLIYFCLYFFIDEFMLAFPGFHFIERLILSIIMLFIILEQSYSKNSFFKLSKFKAISYLGNMTYGMYCLHFIGILITLIISKKIFIQESIFKIMFFDFFVSLAITILISYISYRYFEYPFLKLKSKFL